jgi:DNA-binding ferritin-like protein
MAETQYPIEQEYGEVEDNALMIPTEAATQIVEALNTDLASMYVLHHQYHKHRWVVEGPQFRELEQLFTMHAEQVEAAAVELGDRVNTLGGVPASGLRKQLEETYVAEEPDGILAIRDMLERDVQAERTIANKLREHARLATQLGDWGTEDLLKDTLQATEKRADFVQKHLQRESLSRPVVGTKPVDEAVTPTVQNG